MSKIIVGNRAKRVFDLLTDTKDNNPDVFKKIVHLFNADGENTGIFVDDNDNEYMVYSISEEFFLESYKDFGNAFAWLTGGIDDNSVTIRELNEAIKIYNTLNK